MIRNIPQVGHILLNQGKIPVCRAYAHGKKECKFNLKNFSGKLRDAHIYQSLAGR